MDREDAEQQIKLACQAADFGRGTTLTLEQYGDELLSFLTARLRSQDDAQEAFSSFAEDLWTGLPKFEFRSSVRTWAYTLARNAANRYASAPARRRDRNLAFSQHAEVSQLVERVRSRTREHQRTEVKDRLRAMRERLDPDDQTLLILRVDRNMAWRDLAEVMADGAVDPAQIEREAARLRKRFERVKAELKQMAQAEGLLPKSAG